jgi:MFS family permease
VLGGQGALVVFAGLVLLASPLNAVAVRQLRRRERAAQTLAPAAPGVLGAALRRPAFWMIAAGFLAVYLNHGILITYALILFADRGAGPGLAALAAACIGPAQVAGRLALMAAGARVTTAQATMASLGGVVVAGVLLWLAGVTPLLIFGFALAQGAGIGLTSILRPVLIAEILGREGFGAISGAAAVAPILASAAAPTVGALLLGAGGTGLVLAVCLGLAVIGLALMGGLLAARDRLAG